MNTNELNGQKAKPLNAVRAQSAYDGVNPHKKTHTNGSQGSSAQWRTSDAKLPPRAFELSDKEKDRFYRLTHSVELSPAGAEKVERLGGEIFDATYAPMAARFESELAAGQLELDRLNAEKARLLHDKQLANDALTDTTLHVEEEKAEPKFPSAYSVKWWTFVSLLMLLTISWGAALFQIASLLLPTMQSWLVAGFAATPWLGAAVAAEIFALRTIKSDSPRSTWPLRGAMVLLFVGVILWLMGLIPLAESFSLSATTVQTVLVPDRRLAVIGQLICELTVSFLILNGMLSQLSYRRATILNENRQPIIKHLMAIEQQLATLGKHLATVTKDLGKPDGNLRAWKSSRAAFIEEGIAILKLRADDEAFLADMERRIEQIQQKRGQKQQLLEQFSSPSTNNGSANPKSTPFVLLFVLCSLLMNGNPAAAQVKDFVIGLSPFEPLAERSQHQSELQRFLLSDSPNESHIVIWDAWNLRVIADAQLTRLAYDSVPARASRLAPTLSAIKSWYDKAAGLSFPAAQKAAIKFPEWLELATAKAPTQNRSVIVLGSPFYHPNEHSFTMVEMRYPSDGHLGRTTAETPYGIANKRGRLANTQVFWAYHSETIWGTEIHRDRVARWWALFVAGQDGVLAGFTSDTPQMLRDATIGNSKPISHFSINPNDMAVIMHVATPRDVSSRTGQVALPPPTPLPASPVPSPKPQSTGLKTGAVEQPTDAAKLVLLAPQLPPTSSLPIAPVPMTLDVVVNDASGRAIPDIRENEFAILEKGVPQKITTFKCERFPLSILLLIDTSGSIAAKLTKIRAAAASIVSQGCVDDEWAVVEFKAAPILRQDFTTNTVLVGSSLNALSSDGPTALLDAIRFSMDHLDRRARHQQKIVVLVTDGDEQHSKSTRDDLIERLRVSNTHFYAIGFPEGARPIDSDSLVSRAVSLQAEALAKKLLEEMAKASKNGRAFFPKKTSELEGIANSIISDLRSPRYRFTYYSTNRISAATSSAEVQVRLKPPQRGGELTARICGIYEVP